MKLVLKLVCVGGLCAATALAQSPVTLTIGKPARGPAIPDDFIGLSFGMKTLPPEKNGAHLFSPTNTPLITLFRNLGLRHFRAGGTTVESPPSTPIPDETDIDNLFDFARKAGVAKVIYSFRLLETDPSLNYAATNAALARYIWDHDQPLLECFAIGNEPDLKRVFYQDATIRDFKTYLVRWRKFAAAITNAVPQARFAGPDAGSANVTWTVQFAREEQKSGLLATVVEHYYAGGKGKGVSPEEGIKTMLSPEWTKNYAKLYKKAAAPVISRGIPFRFTEANDHYSGGIRDASDTFAGALWALDFLHWWAAHDAQGVDFHNTTWVSSDIIAPDANRQLETKPKGYGLKAFDLGGHGVVTPVSINNREKINLTAYAVQDTNALFVTIINKDYGAAGHDANVTIKAGFNGKDAKAIFLTAPGGDVTSKSGVTLGGTAISNDAPWRGQWTPLAFVKPGQYEVKVPAASAAIVRIAQ